MMTRVHRAPPGGRKLAKLGEFRQRQISPQFYSIFLPERKVESHLDYGADGRIWAKLRPSGKQGTQTLFHPKFKIRFGHRA